MKNTPNQFLVCATLAGIVTACGDSTPSSAVSTGGTQSTGGNVATSTTVPVTSTGIGGETSSGGGVTRGGSGGQLSTSTGGSGGQLSTSTGGSSATGGQSIVGYKPWTPSAACAQKASALVEQLSVAQRVGQMTQVNSSDTKQVAVSPSAVTSGFLGSVLSGGGTYPSANDISVSAWTSMITSYVDASKSASPHVGLLFGLDSVHGNDKVKGSVMFPHNIGLGATRNEQLVENVTRITALEMLGVGANWAFAPAVGAARDIRWGRTFESFSSEPDLASQLGAAAVKGLQNGKLGATQSVLACAKHFAGDGATDGGKNTGDVTLLDEAAFRKIAVDPYRASIAAGVGSIMPSYSSYMGEQMTNSKKWLTDVLKTELGFAGFLISDWDAVGRLTSKTVWNDQVAAAVSAGIDMLMVSGGATGTATTSAHSAAEVASALTAFNNASQANAVRVKDAVTRILTIKCEMGLLDGDTSVDASLTSAIGSAEHRTVARDAVRQSLVLLKNDGILPLSDSVARIHVTGSGADSLAKQCGGWTLGWQGMGTTGVTSTNVGTTVLAAVKKRYTGTVTSSTDGSGATDANLAIVVVGESPYAETQGDTKNGAAPTLTSQDFAAIAAVKAANVPFVVVLFSGRPLMLTDANNVSALDESNAFIAAWLPGTEGDGIADVLFGDYKPTGKLSFAWPATASQIPLNVGDGKTPLFAYGFGLTYP